MNINEGVPMRRYVGSDVVVEFKTDFADAFVPLDSIPCDVWEKAVTRPMQHIQGFNIITDNIKHVPKSIMYRGLKLYPNKRGVLVMDWWPGGGMEIQCRSMRTARVFAKGWTNS